MDAAIFGFAIFLVLSLVAAVLLARLVIRGVKSGHSTSTGFGEGGYFFSESDDEGGGVKEGVGTGLD